MKYYKKNDSDIKKLKIIETKYLFYIYLKKRKNNMHSWPRKGCHGWHVTGGLPTFKSYPNFWQSKKTSLSDSVHFCNKNILKTNRSK